MRYIFKKFDIVLNTGYLKYLLTFNTVVNLCTTTYLVSGVSWMTVNVCLFLCADHLHLLD